MFQKHATSTHVLYWGMHCRRHHSEHRFSAWNLQYMQQATWVKDSGSLKWMGIVTLVKSLPTTDFKNLAQSGAERTQAQIKVKTNWKLVVQTLKLQTTQWLVIFTKRLNTRTCAWLTWCIIEWSLKVINTPTTIKAATAGVPPEAKGLPFTYESQCRPSAFRSST